MVTALERSRERRVQEFGTITRIDVRTGERRIVTPVGERVVTGPEIEARREERRSQIRAEIERTGEVPGIVEQFFTPEEVAEIKRQEEVKGLVKATEKELGRSLTEAEKGIFLETSIAPSVAAEKIKESVAKKEEVAALAEERRRRLPTPPPPAGERFVTTAEPEKRIPDIRVTAPAPISRTTLEEEAKAALRPLRGVSQEVEKATFFIGEEVGELAAGLEKAGRERKPGERITPLTEEERFIGRAAGGFAAEFGTLFIPGPAGLGRRAIAVIAAKTPEEAAVALAFGGIIGGSLKAAPIVGAKIVPFLGAGVVRRGAVAAGKFVERKGIPAFFAVETGRAVLELGPSFEERDIEAFREETQRLTSQFAGIMIGARAGEAAVGFGVGTGALALKQFAATRSEFITRLRKPVSEDIALFESIRIEKGKAPPKITKPARLQIEEGLGVFERIERPKPPKIKRPARLGVEEELGVFAREPITKIVPKTRTAQLQIEEGLSVFARAARKRVTPKEPVRVEFVREEGVDVIQRQIKRRGRDITEFPRERKPLKFAEPEIEKPRGVRARAKPREPEAITVETVRERPATREQFVRDFRRHIREEAEEIPLVFAEGFEPTITLPPALRMPELPKEITRERVAVLELPQITPIGKEVGIALEVPVVQEILLPKLVTPEKQKPLDIQIPAAVEISIPREVQREREVLLEVQIPKEVTRELQRELQKTKEILKIREREELIETKIEKLEELPRVVIPGLGLPFFLESKTRKRRVKKVPGYHTEVKSEGKWLRVEGVRTRKRALGLGAETIDNSASASFRIRKANKSIAPVPDNRIWDAIRPKFRRQKKGKSIVEKNTFRIDSFGELQGITAKGLLALRNLRASGVKIKRRKKTKRRK